MNVYKFVSRDKAKFQLGDVETDWVKLNQMVGQGCVLSPTLFNLYIEELIVRIRNKSLWLQCGHEMCDEIAIIFTDGPAIEWEYDMWKNMRFGEMEK